MKNFKAGKFQINNKGDIAEYKSFLPASINRPFLVENQNTLILLEEATRLLGEVNAYTKFIPDIDFFIQMHIRKEAVSSSRIEGTKTGMSEVLLPEEEIIEELRDDWREVNNYIDALSWSIKELNKTPLSVRLLKNTHKILLSNTRGNYKSPGELRTSQNWIGGSSIRTAHFIPPHHKQISTLLSDWENSWHNHTLNIPTLIQIAIMHYQFETIHPFLDGNGRIGRLFMTLQLIERNFLDKPVLYISSYFEEFRPSYYENLDRVRTHNELEQWIRFFLEGIIYTSNKGKKKLEQVLILQKQYEQDIQQLGKKRTNAQQLLNYLFSQPSISIKTVTSLLNIQYNAANNLVKDFIKLNILVEKTKKIRNRYFEMHEYIKLFTH